MPINKKRMSYWRRVCWLTDLSLALWVAITFGATFFAKELNTISVSGFPLGYYMAAQGSLIIYVLIVVIYSWVMNRLDRRFVDAPKANETK